jgi:hypothetical protein
VWNPHTTAGSFAGGPTPEVKDVEFAPGTDDLVWITLTGNRCTFMTSAKIRAVRVLPEAFCDSDQPLEVSANGTPIPPGNTQTPDVPGEVVVPASSRRLPQTTNSIGTIVQEPASQSVAFTSGSYLWVQSAPGEAPVKVVAGGSTDAQVMYYGPDPQE